MKNNNVVCIDAEAAEVALFEEALSFDIVVPRSANGESGVYHVDITVEMSNGDVVKYYYNEGRPYSSGKYEHYLSINGKIVDANENDESEPLNFIRNTYQIHLIRKIQN